ncbi:MAG: HAMP domain-containing histidine kinase [Flavobacteriaceae bacterium]|nr:HAMP domain-containing histidine kinase [Flavobacteriaceae bacterium]
MLKLKKHITIVLVTIVVLIILGMLSYTGLRMTERNTPLIDAAMEIKYELSLFHLWFEEMMQGDSSNTKTKVWQHLEQSRWYANAMLNGGQNSEGVFIPLEDPRLRKLITSSLASINSLQQTAVQRLQKIKSSQAGSKLDQKFDHQYQLAINSADKVESALHELIQNELDNYRILSITLVLIVICIGTIISYIFNKYDKNRNQLLAQLSESNKYLESQVNIRTHELSLALALAENSSQAKSEFLSSMSHEFRTPLNAILGFSQLIEMNTKDDKARDNSQEIINAGSHLLNLIEEILDLSKIESGVIELSNEIVCLEKILKDTLALINPLAEKNFIQINNKVSTSLNINVDKMRFKQILLNILSNAIKYNSENGKVIIDYSTDNNMLGLSITDTGKGLTPEQQISAFKPFDRAGFENSNVEGIGLGLKISKDFIELMGGTITVESTIGKGSRFLIQLPL